MSTTSLPSELNERLEVAVQANAFLSALFPRTGTLLLGESGIEFRGRAAAGFVQVPWGAVRAVRVDVYGDFVRSVEIVLDDGRALPFVVSDGAEVVRCMSRHLERSQLVPAKRILGGAIRRMLRLR